MRENVRNMSRGRAGRERWEFALDNRQIAAVVVGALVIVGSSFVLGMNAGRSMARQAPKAAVANALDAFDTAHENLPTPPEPKNWEYEKLGGARTPDAAPPSGASAQARVPPPARPLAARPAQDASAPAETSKASIAAAVAAANAPAPAATNAPAATTTPAPERAKPSPAPSGAPAAVAAAKPTAAPAATGTGAKPAASERSAMDKAIAAVSGTAPHAGSAAAGPGTTTARPVAKPAARSASGAFVIQVGASPNRSEADRIAKRFAARGARVVAADVDGKRWYRVRLASTTYGDRSEAERALSRLSRETGVRGFVTAAQ